MSGLLLAQPVFRAVDATGAPMPGAQLQFYLTGTTTPTPVYSSAALSTPLSNPVVADSGGLFPSMWLDPTVTYRVQLLTSVGALVQDIDPVSESVVEATQAQVNAGTATGVFVSPAKLAAWTGIAAALGFTPLNKAGDTATNLQLAFSAFAVNSAGYLGAPINEQDGSYTLQCSDAGKMVRAMISGAATYTVPPNFAQLGQVILVRNAANSTASLTVARGSGVTLYGAGGTTSKDWTLAPGALASIGGEANNTWWISGAGVS
ncbi:MAG: hypothetical protein JO111_12980 [Caulobacteraceae bacterium]|nr:hypothetical protein [Caulobacteraceae bacterium]